MTMKTCTAMLLAALLAVTHAASMFPLPTELEKMAEFEEDDLVFDFYEKLTGDDVGQLVGAGRASFPPTSLAGIAYTLIVLEPCSMNVPHIHPRGSEFSFLFEGDNVRTAMVEENGGRVLETTLRTGQATMFYAGLPHLQVNMGCETAKIMSGFPSDDPGTVTVATRTFEFADELLSQAFGLPIDEIKEIREGLPSSPAPVFDKEECRKMCRK